MKKAVLALASIVLLPAVVQAVYAPIPAIEQQNPFTVSIEAGVGYDSNVLSTPNKIIGGVKYVEIDSSYYSVSPTFKYNGHLFGSDQTLLGIFYAPEYYQYEDRGVGGDKSLVNHRGGVSLDHAFNDSLRLRMDDQFSYIQNPASALTPGVGGTPYLNQSYNLNAFNSRLSYDVNSRNAVVGKYRNTWYDYTTAPLSSSLDRDENLFGVEYRYKNTANSAIVGEYRFQDVNYRRAPKADSTSNFALIGYDHDVNDKLSYQSRIGVEFRDHDSNGDSTNPYGELTGAYIYAPGSSLSGGLYYRTAESSSIGSHLNQENAGVFFNLSHAFSGTVTGSANVGYEHGKLEDAVLKDIKEDTLRAGLGLTWAFAERWELIATYDYDNVSSDNAVREYDRNRFSLNTRYTFGFGR